MHGFIIRCKRNFHLLSLTVSEHYLLLLAKWRHSSYDIMTSTTRYSSLWQCSQQILSVNMPGQINSLNSNMIVTADISYWASTSSFLSPAYYFSFRNATINGALISMWKHPMIHAFACALLMITRSFLYFGSSIYLLHQQGPSKLMGECQRWQTEQLKIGVSFPSLSTWISTSSSILKFKIPA